MPLLHATGCSVIANGFGWIGWELLLLAAASEYQSFCQLALRVTTGAGRGDFEVLVYRTSCVFIDTTFSMQIGGRVSQRMIASDLFWKNFKPIL